MSFVRRSISEVNIRLIIILFITINVFTSDIKFISSNTLSSIFPVILLTISFNKSPGCIRATNIVRRRREKRLMPNGSCRLEGDDFKQLSMLQLLPGSNDLHSIIDPVYHQNRQTRILSHWERLRHFPVVIGMFSFIFFANFYPYLRVIRQFTSQFSAGTN